MQSGKSTLFSAISGKEPSMIGSTTIEEAIVPVPDSRLEFLAELYQPQKVVHATIDCLDTPGFSFTDDSSRTAARRLIDKVRTVEMFVIVVRAFENPAVPAYRDRLDPAADLNELATEFLLADLELVATRIERLEKQLKKPGKNAAADKAEYELQQKIQAVLESEEPASAAIETKEEQAIIKPLGLLTCKPFMIVVNLGEENITQTDPPNLGPSAENRQVITLCAEMEKELSELDPQSRAEFMADLGIKKPAINKFVQSCYSTLGLISFLTVGKDEVRAWPIKKGTSALDAAGKIHSDIKRGFIRAETMAYDDLKQLGDEKAVKAAGKARLEGKTYSVNDGDVISFRFNV
jgi:hypothetical protein